jgi:hypothetical protein
MLTITDITSLNITASVIKQMLLKEKINTSTKR